MTKKLTTYETHQKKVIPKKDKPKPSGVACTELKCKGEMVIEQPDNFHPQLKQLRRAHCNKCGWRGWV